MSPNKRTGRKRDYVGVLSSVFAIVIGLLVGFVILLICNPSQALPGFVTILTGAFTHGLKGVGQVFYYATPIILTGLSVGFAFKTGLFNIGTPGQFIVGAFAAVYVGIMWTGLGRIQWAVALLAAILGGALWGMVPGVLKACFNVNEVIASIMMNYIGMYMVNWIVKSYKPLFNNLRNESRNVAATAQIPKMGMDKLFPESSVGGGIPCRPISGTGSTVSSMRYGMRMQGASGQSLTLLRNLICMGRGIGSLCGSSGPTG